MTIRKPSEANFTLDDYEKQGFFDAYQEMTNTISETDKKNVPIFKKS